MNQDFLGYYESYLGDERKLKEYQRRRTARTVPVVKVELDEADFERTISVTADRRVFYIDHVLLGTIKNGRFVSDRWAYKVVSMAGVRKVKWYLEGGSLIKSSFKSLSLGL